MSKTLGSWTYTVTKLADRITITTVSGQLDNNYEYTIKLPAGLESSKRGIGDLQADHEISFTSTYLPRFTTPEMVRLEVGPVISDIPDDTINRIIMRHSRDLEITGDNIGVAVDRDDPAYWVERYAIYASALNLVDIMRLRAAHVTGSKRLGDFSITKSYNPKLLEDTRKAIQKKLQHAKSLLRNPRTWAELSKNDPRSHPPNSRNYGRYPVKKDREKGTGPWMPPDDDSRWYSYDDITTTDDDGTE